MPTIFDIFKEKLQDNKQATEKVTVGILEEIRTKYKINSLKKQKEQYYLEIGKKFYKMYLNDYGAVFDDEMKAIHELQDKEEQLEKTILKPKGKASKSKRVCISCGSTIDDDAIYCPYCGAQDQNKRNVVCEEVIEDEEKKQAAFEIDQPQDEYDFFNPNDDDADKTVKKNKNNTDDDFSDFFRDTDNL